MKQIENLAIDEIKDLEKYIKDKLGVDNTKFTKEDFYYAMKEWIIKNNFQINDAFEEGILELKYTRQLRRTIQKIRHVNKKQEKSQYRDHNIGHVIRVLLNASVLMSIRRDMSDRDREIILTAIEYHDNGRVNDYEDAYHGERFIQMITNELDGYTVDEQNIIKFIIAQHCKSKEENEEEIKKIEEDKQTEYRKFLNYLKDADKLDRVRFLGNSDFLNPDRLAFEESKEMIEFAQESLNRFHEIIETNDDKTLRALFRRDIAFAQGEFGEELATSVENVLKENGYPNRSEQIYLNNTIPLNDKFIKDDYIYLLRGGRREQMSGFYSYSYCFNKQNMQDYCKKNGIDVEELVYNHRNGTKKGWFISATTNIAVTTYYARENGENREDNGSVYILKVKRTDVKRMKSFVYNNQIILDESEYLIPDYVKPEEIIKEFEYTDYMGIYRYLTQEIGLNIVPEDFGGLPDIEQCSQILIKDGDRQRKMHAYMSKLNEENDVERWVQ